MSIEWLPWLQTIEKTGYEGFISVLETNCIKELKRKLALQPLWTETLAMVGHWWEINRTAHQSCGKYDFWWFPQMRCSVIKTELVFITLGLLLSLSATKLTTMWLDNQSVLQHTVCHSAIPTLCYIFYVTLFSFQVLLENCQQTAISSVMSSAVQFLHNLGKIYSYYHHSNTVHSSQKSNR